MVEKPEGKRPLGRRGRRWETMIIMVIIIRMRECGKSRNAFVTRGIQS